MFEAITTLTLLGIVFGLALGFAARRLLEDDDSLTEKINAVLPQTQCAQCGYPGCRPYAQAIADNEADINLCPPGGEATLRALSDLLGRDPAPLDLSRGETKAPQVARVDESRCIGCALCLKACPVDAIVGAHGYMHTVIETECTGCELCIAPCPVDCIELFPTAEAVPQRHPPRPQQALAAVN